jgi:ankyrin repeat protein
VPLCPSFDVLALNTQAFVQTGITPLMKAAEKGHETCVAALCDAGASVQLYDKVHCQTQTLS